MEWVLIDHVPDLEMGDVAVWQFNPKDLTQYARSLESYLSSEEKKRLDRFISLEARQEFALCRGILHFLLARLTGGTPEHINIKDGSQGKPEFVDEHQAHSLTFNISHTECMCLIAFSSGGDAGVDVEKVHAIKDLPRLAQTYLSPEELIVWQGTQDKHKAARFLEFWCAKEAILKAAGCGLTIHPSQVNTLEALAGRAVRGMQEDGCFFEFRDCWIKKLPLPEDYRGWLAVFGAPAGLRFYRFNAQLLDAVFASDGRNVEK
jgi:phosphopantetheinyl transferase